MMERTEELESIAVVGVITAGEGESSSEVPEEMSEQSEVKVIEGKGDMEVLKVKNDNVNVDGPEDNNKKGKKKEEVEGKRGEEPQGAAGGGNNKPARSTKHLDIRRERGIKLCVRRLPPDMTKKDFLKVFEPLPEYNYVTVNNPDREWVDGRSTAWINFTNDEDAAWFMGRFNGYSLVDNRSTTYTIAVDLSPELSVPRHVRYNKKRGTLVNSAHYQKFVSKLEEKKSGKDEETVSVEKMLEEIEKKADKKKEAENTPLVDYILHKKSKEHSVSPEKSESKRRDRDRRDKENREHRGDVEDRASRKERRRDRDKKRDKDRKDRRVRDKIEKEAQAKGMTVTYSRSGKVTRWSANSFPLAKKEGPSTSLAGATAKSAEPTGEETVKTEKAEKNENNEKAGNADETGNKPVKLERKPFPGDKPERKSFPADRTERKPFPGDKPARKVFPGDKHEKKHFSTEKFVKKPFPRDKPEQKRTSEDKPEKKQIPEGTPEKKQSLAEKSENKPFAGERKKTRSEASSQQDNPKDMPQSKCEAKEKETKESREANERRRRARPDMPIYRPGSFRTGNGKGGGGGGGGTKRDTAADNDKKDSSGNPADKDEP